MARKSTKRTEEQRMKDTLRKRLQRSRNPDAIREKERIYKAVRRLDPMIRAQERRTDKLRKALKRRDPSYRETEQERNTSQRRSKRQNLQYKAAEQPRKRVMRGIKTTHPEYQAKLKLCETVKAQKLNAGASSKASKPIIKIKLRKSYRKKRKEAAQLQNTE